MQSTLEKLENNRVALKIEVPVEELAKAIDAGYKAVAKQVAIPGFRKGKAPKHVIVAYVGKEPVYKEAIDKLVPQAYGVALKESGIDPVDYPEVNIEQFEEGKPFVFTATVQCTPEVTLGEYKNLSVEAKSASLSDEDIDKEIENMRKRMAKIVDTDRDVVEMGDLVTMDFVGKIEDEPFEGGTAEEFNLEVGSGTLIAGFEDQLVGAKIGEPTTVTVTFPEDYPNKELAGTEAVFDVTIRSIKARELPEVDDEFAKKLGDFETVDALKDEMRKRMSEIAERNAATEFDNEILRIVSDNAQVEIPEVMIERRVDVLVEEFEKQLQYQKRTLKEYYEVTGTEASDLRDSLKERAAREVKMDLVLDAITAAENVGATDEDIDAKVTELAARYKATEELIRESLKREQALTNIKESILREKTVKMLLDGYDKVVKE